MSTNYTPSNQNGSLFSNSTLGFILAVAIFGILPAMHILDSMTNPARKLATSDDAVQPPPPPPEDLPPPPEDKEELDKPDINEPPPPMTLAQLEMALNPGSGNAMGDFGFGDFDTGIDAFEGMQIFDLKDLDKQPKAIYQVKPNYPYALKQAQIAGWVLLEWLIDENGRVLRARAVESTHREFEQPAIDSIMRSKWQPGKKDGKNVNVRVRQRMDFTP